MANTCGACGKLWACALCHEALADHSFEPVDRQLRSVMCGVCGHMMTYAEYGASCPPPAATPSIRGASCTNTPTSSPFAKGEHGRLPALIDVHSVRNRETGEVMSGPGVMVGDN